MSELRIGISGWRYAPWRGVFYPKGLPQRRELEYAASQMNSIEINGSFYSLQTPASYMKWRDETPDDFVFAVKGPRYLTHMKRLRDIEVPMANFFASGVLLLGKKLGPILWQLPPWLPFDPERMVRFFELLPRTHADASLLAAESRLKRTGDPDRPAHSLRIRYVVEPRHESFFTPEFVAVLRQMKIGLVFADSAGKFPYAEDLTADLVYCRLHGSTELYASGYTDEELDKWAARIKKWRAGKQPKDARLIAESSRSKNEAPDVYVYFDNDIKVHAPFNAIGLAKRLNSTLK